HTLLLLDGGDTHRVGGNFFGMRADGVTPASTGSYGVQVGAFGSYERIGGLTAADRNLFGGPSAKVFVNGGTGHTIVGNLIGTDRTGTLARGAQSTGIYVRGTTGPAIDISVISNVIAGNTDDVGVLFLGTQSSTIYGNAIGIGVGGAALPNGDGI